VERDPQDPPASGYAMGVADASYDWYRSAAIRSRRLHRSSAVALQIVAAAIPVAAVVWPRNSLAPALLGAVIIVLTGLRSTFDWQENYLRFSGAREAVEAERRLYQTGANPYTDESVRDRILVTRITRIERNEMNAWFTIAADQPTSNDLGRSQARL
jgi:hypothetical protein